MNQPKTFLAKSIYDGSRLHCDAAIRFGPGGVEAVGPVSSFEDIKSATDLGNDLLSPGFVDLQVNGGGGAMLNDSPTVETVRCIAAAHWSLGVRRLLPTLITDTRENTEAAITAVVQAIEDGTPGVAGLHLEGPHLSVVRKGAHDAVHIRPMEQRDLDLLLSAAELLPVLMVTVAPESVTREQVSALSKGGVVVSLGHTDADYETCVDYAAAGARCVTHLFNAMSQMGSREPGLVGAAIASGGLSAGLIADGIHVHPQMMRVAWQSKQRPGSIFLVSDAMAVAGTDLSAFSLGGRNVSRLDGRLVLDDGTLAGADLDLLSAVRNLVETGIDLADALRAATIAPLELITGATFKLVGTKVEDFVRIDHDLRTVRPLYPTEPSGE